MPATSRRLFQDYIGSITFGKRDGFEIFQKELHFPEFLGQKGSENLIKLIQLEQEKISLFHDTRILGVVRVKKRLVSYVIIILFHYSLDKGKRKGYYAGAIILKDRRIIPETIWAYLNELVEIAAKQKENPEYENTFEFPYLDLGDEKALFDNHLDSSFFGSKKGFYKLSDFHQTTIYPFLTNIFDGDFCPAYNSIYASDSKRIEEMILTNERIDFGVIDIQREENHPKFQSSKFSPPKNKSKLTEPDKFLQKNQLHSNQQKQEEKDWQLACQNNTLSAYLEYINKHPEGKNAVCGQLKLKELEIEHWAEALRRDSQSSYDAFTELFPDSEFHIYAIKRIGELNQAPAEDSSIAQWKQALREKDIRFFINRVSDGPNQELREKSLEHFFWLIVKNSNSIYALNLFIEHCPDHIYVPEAQELIGKLSDSLPKKQNKEKKRFGKKIIHFFQKLSRPLSNIKLLRPPDQSSHSQQDSTQKGQKVRRYRFPQLFLYLVYFFLGVGLTVMYQSNVIDWEWINGKDPSPDSSITFHPPVDSPKTGQILPPPQPQLTDLYSDEQIRSYTQVIGNAELFFRSFWNNRWYNLTEYKNLRDSLTEYVPPDYPNRKEALNKIKGIYTTYHSVGLPKNSYSYKTYAVKANDELESLAKRLNTTPNLIIKFNPGKLEIGKDLMREETYFLIPGKELSIYYKKKEQ